MMSAGRSLDSVTDVEITIICDNFVHRQEIPAGWCFSCLVRSPSQTVLFDTGSDGQMLLENMRLLDINPRDIHTVFISHHHWDHTGGLAAFLNAAGRADVWMPASSQQLVERTAGQAPFTPRPVTKALEVVPGISTTGEISGPVPEHAMIVSLPAGQVVITGCAHPGIVKIVEYARRLRGGPILLAIGGFHLGGHSVQSITAAADRLLAMDVVYAAPTHCSGETARRIFAERFGRRFIAAGTGMIIRASQLTTTDDQSDGGVSAR